ncbi:hypothetical protein BOH78_2539 [Pichia kudriavzevii]|uniref:Uncharacterized protein n=1 Tax=Pichia kudriavzevii TaxID=4909 RepID=A0A1V2LNL0_PICKU|nr:hypothetical protein BOH78_2539 [Pichia kudriavzevii]
MVKLVPHSKQSSYFVLLAIAILGLVYCIYRSQSGYSGNQLEVSLKHQRFGVVTEDGIIQADLVEELDEENNYLKQRARGAKKTSSKEQLKSKVMESRLQRQRERKKARLAKKVDSKNLVGIRNIQHGRASTLEEGRKKERETQVQDQRVDDYIKDGEPFDRLSGMTSRARKLFLRKVAQRKQQLDKETKA